MNLKCSSCAHFRQLLVLIVANALACGGGAALCMTVRSLSTALGCDVMGVHARPSANQTTLADCSSCLADSVELA